MAKVNLQDIGSGYGLEESFNANNTRIESAFDNTLSRDGSTPNHMLSALDMNSYQINNLAAATQANQAVNYAQLVAAQYAGVSAGAAQFVETYAAMRALGTPSTGDVCFVTAEWVNGLFVYDETASDTRTAGINEPSDDATSGAWVRKRQGFLNVRWFGATGDGVTDDAAAIQAAVDYIADSSGPGVDSILYFPAGEYLINSGIDFDRGGITFFGEGRHKGSNINAGQNMEYMIRHRRDSANTSGVHFFHIRVNGKDYNIDRAVQLERITYGTMWNFEIRQVSGTALYGAYLQDWYMDLHVHKCGREYDPGVTASMTASIAYCSVDTTNFLVGDYIKVAGAGPAGADLYTAMDSTLTVAGFSTAETPSTTVSDVACTRILPAVNLHLLHQNKAGDTELSAICNSIVFAPYSTFERNYSTGIALYKVDACSWAHTKHHGRLVGDGDVGGPAEVDLIVADRCERLRFVDLQVISPQRSAIWFKATDGVDASASIIGGFCKDAANYQTATDVQFIKQEGGHLRVANVAFDDDLSHSSYTTNGIDINVLGGTLSGGVNEHYGSPGGGYFYNATPANGSAMVSRPGRPHYVRAEWTPSLTFGGGNTGLVMTTNIGYQVKVGNKVDVWCKLRISNKGTSTGVAELDGLTWNLSNEYSTSTMEWPMVAHGTAYDNWSIRIVEAANTIKFWEPSTGTAKTDADFEIDKDYYLTFTYFVKD